MAWSLNGKPLRKILVTRLRYLGDVVMSTVVLEALRQGDPNLSLGYLCEAGFAPVLKGHPLLDQVHLLDTRRHGSDAKARIASVEKGGGALPQAKGFLGIIQELRVQKYDLAVDLFFNPRSAWLLRLGGIPQRICGTSGSRRHLYTQTARPEDLQNSHPQWSQHAPGGLGHHLSRLAPLVHVETGLGFVDWYEAHGPTHSAPGLSRPILGPGDSAAWAERSLALDQPYMVLAPGATWPSKEWPEQRWVDFVSAAGAPANLLPVLLVPPGREHGWPKLSAAVSARGGIVLPPLPLPRVLDLLAHAQLLVTVDGGIMHTSVGYGIPTVAIFGPTNPELWFPYEQAGPFKVVARRPPCHPCDLHSCDNFICLPDLSADEVLTACHELQNNISEN